MSKTRFIDLSAKGLQMTSRNETLNFMFRGINKEKKSNSLVESNLSFVVSIAKTYQNCGLDMEDLIQFGNIGLIKAAELYDTSKGVEFTTFAVVYVREQIYDGLCNFGRLVRLPRNLNKIGKQHNISGDETLSSDDDNSESRFDMFADDSKANEYDNTQTLAKVLELRLNRLTDKEKAIICRLFGIGCKQESVTSIAYKLGVSKTRVAQIRDSAISKMRK